MRFVHFGSAHWCLTVMKKSQDKISERILQSTENWTSLKFVQSPKINRHCKELHVCCDIYFNMKCVCGTALILLCCGLLYIKMLQLCKTHNIVFTDVEVDKICLQIFLKKKKKFRGLLSNGGLTKSNFLKEKFQLNLKILS